MNPLALLLALAIVAPFVMAWLPIEVSLAQFLIEDMFYYLQGARNLLDQGSVSLDGRNATNGFHPLWMAVSTAVQWACAGSRDAAVHGLSTCSALATAAFGLVLYRTLSMVSGLLALPLAVLLLFNYQLLAIAMGGLETPLSMLAVLLVARSEARRGSDPAARSPVRLGLLLGLVCLARMDGLLLSAIVLLWHLLRPASPSARLIPERGRRWRLPARNLRFVTSAGGVTLLMLLPWFAFSWRSSGVLLPNSWQAKASWWNPPWPADAGFWATLGEQAMSRAQRLIEPSFDLLSFLGLWPLTPPLSGPARYLAVLPLLAIGLALVLLVVKRGPSILRDPLGWIPVFVVAHCGFYACNGNLSFRYLAPVIGAASVFLAREANERWGNQRQPVVLRRIRAALLVLLGGATISGVYSLATGYGSSRWHPVHSGLRDVAAWIATNTPHASRIGSFNAGILSYYSQRPVTNLDGVINDSAIAAIRQRRLDAYVGEQGLTYLADVESQIHDLMTRFSGREDWRSDWEEVHSVAVPDIASVGTVDLVVLRRLR